MSEKFWRSCEDRARVMKFSGLLGRDRTFVGTYFFRFHHLNLKVDLKLIVPRWNDIWPFHGVCQKYIQCNFLLTVWRFVLFSLKADTDNPSLLATVSNWENGDVCEADYKLLLLVVYGAKSATFVHFVTLFMVRQTSCCNNSFLYFKNLTLFVYTQALIQIIL